MNTRRILATSIALLLAGTLHAADITATWNGTTGNWTDAARWSSNPLFPNNGNGGFTFDAAQSSGTLTLDQAITIEKFNFTGGTQTGGFNLTLNDALTWTAGTMSGAGTTSVAGVASTISGTSQKGLNRVLSNSGTVTYSTTDVTNAISFGLGSGVEPGVLNNSGTFNVTAGGDFAQNFPNTGHAINNSGNWNVSGATFTSSVGNGIAFNNTGTVEVDSGTLSLGGGGTSTGSFATAGGAALNFTGGTHLLDNGAAFTGGGAATVAGGTVTAGDGAGDVITAETFGMSSGTINGLGSFNIGNLAWSGGTMSGTGSTSVSGAASTISGTSQKGLNRVLSNSGTITYSTSDLSGAISFGLGSGVEPGVLNNSGTFNVTAGGDFAQNFPNTGHAINNSGTWNVSGAAGTTSSVGVGIAFNNTGMVNAAFAGAVFNLNRLNSNDGSTFTGLGVTRVTDSFGIAGTTTIASGATLQFVSGSLSGTGTITGDGAFNWTGGTMSGSGTTTLEGAASTISGTSQKGLNRVLSNSGTITYSTTDVTNAISFGLGSGVEPGVLNNSGTFNVTAGGDFAQNFPNTGHAINNSGNWNVSGATFTSSVGNGIAFNNTGTVEVDSGTLALGGGGTSTGSFATAGGAALEFSGGTHLLDNGAAFTGGGAATVAGGTVTAGDGAGDVITAETFGMSSGTINGLGSFNIGNLAWSGGTMSGTGSTSVSGAASTISGTSQKGLNRVLSNSGTVTYSTTDVTNAISFGLGSGVEPGVLNNSGTFNVTAGGDFGVSNPNAGHAINNSGTWNVSGATFTSNVASGIAFNNTGTINAAVAGAVFNLSQLNSNDGSTFTGLGATRVTDSFGIAGTTTIASGATLQFVSGSLSGTGTITGAGAFNWSGGTMSGPGTTTLEGAASTISGTSQKFLGRTLSNSGTITYTTSDVTNPLFFGPTAATPGVLNNSGTFNVTAGGDFGVSNPNAGHAINNSGNWNVSGATFTSNVGSGIAFNNTGAVSVNSGTLSLGGGGTSTGSFATAGGATLNFTGGTHLLDNGAAFTGAGAATVAGGTVTAGNGAADVITAATFGVSSGTHNGLGSFNIGDLAWSGGTMDGTGSTNASGAASTISGTSQKFLGRTLSNSGTITYTTSDVTNPLFFGPTAATPGVLNNSGTFNVTAGGDFGVSNPNAGHAINNSGNWNVSGATFTSNVGSGIAFNNTGAVSVSSGTLSLNGTVTQHSGTTLTGGTWNVTNGGVISITTGSNILTNQGSVTLDGAGSNFARLTTALNNNQGSLTLKNNRDLATAGALLNSGNVIVEDAPTVMSVSGAYTQTAGSTALVADATLSVVSFSLQGGMLAGTGTVALAMNNDLVAQSGAKIAPGNSAGTLAVSLSGTGKVDLTLAVAAPATGALLFELGAPLFSDRIVVTGGAVKIGTGGLEFDDFLFTPLAGFGFGTYTLIDGNTAIDGTLGANLSGGIGGFTGTLSIADGGRDVVLTVVPEPHSALLLAGSGIGLLLCWRRVRRMSPV